MAAVHESNDAAWPTTAGSTHTLAIAMPSVNELIIGTCSLDGSHRTISDVHDQNGDSFTDIQTRDGTTNGYAGGTMRMKIADGDETSIDFDLSGNTLVSVECNVYSGLDAVSPLEASNIDFSNENSVVTSQGTNSATAVQADGLAVHAALVQESRRWGSGDSVSSSNGTIRTSLPSGTFRPGHVVSDDIYSSAGAKNTTFSTSDTGSQAVGIVAVFKEASAGGSYTLTCDSGSYAYTGTEASTLAGRSLSADSGSYAYSGTAVRLTYAASYDLACDSGTYAYTGAQAGLIADRAIACGTAAYTYGGAAVTFTTGYGLSLDSGSYSYSGTALGFKRGLVMGMDGGSYIYSGATIVFSYSGGSIWTVVPDNSTNWSVQAGSSDLWTVQPDSSDTWTVQ